MSILPEATSGAAPLISVVMANFEAGDKIVHALHSVLQQSVSDLEVIVSDDGSGDDSLAHVRRLMEVDGRIRLITTDQNGGPARCRNRALDAARGRWIAVVDSDDIIHPERFERLLAAAAAHDADIVADDLLLFFEDGSAPRLMLGEGAQRSFLVSTERWVLAGTDGSPALGYLKPLISAERLKAARYDEALRIGEDFDLILRLLLEGARLLVVPEPFYLYRRHSGSISHRLSVADMEAMVARQKALLGAYGPLDGRIAAAFAQRLSGLEQGLAYERLVAAVKARRLASVLALMARNPGHVWRLWSSFAEGRQRRATPAQAALPSPVLVLGAGAGEMVPAYVPISLMDWSAPAQRDVWRGLAARRGTGAVRCIPLDAAGRYAAGFIPEAIVAEPEIVREAS
ncbi:glycosyltransferase family 2 protein [Devosia riboflavina]|uniref:glycosyltransferase family 2 protein n=1 Tax=Devosia riboflavina TaxID=46914 RepID=UPI00068A7BE8|nr:glycosyltransferase family 2 protein [Devosia riboflavina]